MPKIVNKSIEYFRFNELSDKAKEKAIQHEYETYPDQFLKEVFEEDAKQLLSEELPHAEYLNIAFDLSYSPGSGAVIEFEYTNLDSFLEDFRVAKKFLDSKNIKLTDENKDSIEFKFTCKCSRRCCMQDLNWEILGYDDNTDKIAEILDDYINKEYVSNSTIDCIISSLQYKFEKKCYDYYEHLFDSDDYWDYHWFDKDGNFLKFDN